MLPRVPRLIASLFTHPDLSDEARKRFVIFASCLLVLIPAILLFSGVICWYDHWSEAWPAALLAGSMLVLLMTMKSLRSIAIPFRLMATLCLLTLSFQLHNGVGGGNVFVWLYCFPMAVLYISGKREGLIWIGASLALAFWLFILGPSRVHYGPIVTLRFLLTYTIVTAISYGLESSRTHYSQVLTQEKHALEEALRHIKTLRGLLPICASCKSIRDDHGYWNQLEKYLNEHSEARLSHGICPNCLERLYPEAYAELNNTGKLRQYIPDPRLEEQLGGEG